MFRKILLLILFVLPFSLASQQVALVLSGGGAKAYSHIGVLKALEENNIPIDYIVGNSMGALIGALYSAGYTPEEIELFLTDPNFLNLSKNSSYGNRSLFQKIEPDAALVNFPFNIDKGLKIQLPISVYNFKEIDYALMEYFSGASAVSGNNFDSLMIPFRCVAADIDSSRLVSFENGNLANAVRASITFPFFVRPIEIDSILFFDGGMYNNFPVNIAINEFHPDFIIGSKAVNNFSSPHPDYAISLIQSMLMAKTDFKIDSSLGVVIESKSGDESIFQFAKVHDYIDSGYVAAQHTMSKIISKIESKSKVISTTEKRNKFNARKPKRTIGNVGVTGTTQDQKIYFSKLIGDSGSYKNTIKFGRFYRRLLSNENVTDIYPEMEFDSTKENFNLNLIIRKSEPFNLGIGGYISSSGVNEGFLELGYKHLGRTAQKYSVGAYFGTFYNSFSLKGRIEFPGTLPLYVKLDLLISRKNYFSNARYFYEDQFPAYIISDENYGEISFGVPIGNSGVINAGLSNVNAYYQYYQDNYFTRTDTADVSNFYFLVPFMEYEINSLNRKMYPTTGQHLYLGFGYYSGNEKYREGSGKSPSTEFTTYLNYYTLSFKYLKYFKLFHKFSFGFSSELGLSSKPLLNSYISSLLLATPYEPIPVMKTLFLENYRSNNYGGVGGTLVYNFYKQFDFRLSGYYYVPYNKLLKATNNKPYLSAPFTYHYLLGSVRLVYRPPIGVISASVNYMEKPGSKVGFLLNLGFLIFNKSRLNR
ncbi:MAG TPA: patatin-like phospholipase family protein [Bacteroidales bacterium]|nr:patatin-like phospholipase family protein [Bacteroidales bacterium]